MSLVLRDVLAPLLLLVVILLETSGTTEAFGLPQPTQVKIHNILETKEALGVHCLSKDDDLGVHVVNLNETYEFDFKTNVWGTTLFHCGFQWASSGKLQRFDIFSAKRDSCFDCDWNVLAAGPCLKGGKCYPWK